MFGTMSDPTSTHCSWRVWICRRRAAPVGRAVGQASLSIRIRGSLFYPRSLSLNSRLRDEEAEVCITSHLTGSFIRCHRTSLSNLVPLAGSVSRPLLFSLYPSSDIRSWPKQSSLGRTSDTPASDPNRFQYNGQPLPTSLEMGRSYSLIAAKPYTFTFEVERTALVIIDVQKDFVDPDGFGAIQCGSEEIFASVRDVVPKIKKVLDMSRDMGLHVFHTREGHEPDLSDLASSKRDRQINSPHGHHTLGIGEKGPMGRLLVRGEGGHGIVEELGPVPGEVVVDKPGKGSFWGTEFHRKLMARGISHLLFCGVTTE